MLSGQVTSSFAGYSSSEMRQRFQHLTTDLQRQNDLTGGLAESLASFRVVDFKLDNLPDLFNAYNETGTECMMLQQFIDWEKYVRCICLGQEKILPIKFDANAPWPHRYFVDEHYLTPAERDRVIDWALKINQALGYDMNTVEFALRDGVPYAIDFTNPAPDFEITSLTDTFFPWVVNGMADLCIELALGKRKQERLEPRWDHLLKR